ncbi:inositol-pentakisphosphate 2-kinase-like [Haliotis rufescens]|uniref:inositol-pentakisphosphate 2-kinase-like n=1 Tax=Haliotis rufescens TaxID=6454 RepID=UPI00201F9C3E|nr:inositol-pentakisphosphate 2-kinase-like [Haliotis rufescens]
MARSMHENAEWKYRGEGNCSLVVADPETHQVYRLVKTYFTQAMETLYPLDSSEPCCDHIVIEMRKIVDYVTNVMQPLLSPKFVTPPVVAEISEGFAEEAEKRNQNMRPASRRKKSVDLVDARSRSALVMPDFCFVSKRDSIPVELEETQPTISIEIKPKKAFIPSPVAIDRTSIKHQVCKFCMHQRLKTKAGKWPETSHYCPLDLFSGNPHQMKHALLSLVKTPQNNLKICKNGQEIYGACVKQDLSVDLEDFFKGSQHKKHRYEYMLLDLVIKILLAPGGRGGNCSHTHSPRHIKPQRCQNSKFEHTNGDVSLSYLPHGCVLERICSIQKLDDLDIENIYPLYHRLQARLKDHPTDRIHWGLDGPYTRDLWMMGSEVKASVPVSSLEFAVEKVKRFLISKTVQDCSIIVALQPVKPGVSEENSIIHFNDAYYRYSIELVDLDPKPFDKIEQYYRQDMDIVHAYQETIGKSRTKSV